MVKRFAKHVFLTFVVVLLIVFVVGILLGKGIGTGPEDQITRSMQSNELDTESFLIEQELFKTADRSGCDLAKIRLTDLSNELGKTGRRLVAEGAQKELGLQNFQFLKLKYHIMQIRAYLLFNKLMEKCNTTYNVILYYYGTNDQYSEEQGLVLDRIVAAYNVSVFAIEYNYSNELKFLERYYNITETPSIVINYNQKRSGLVGYDLIASDLWQR
jgi:hypothetical protein